mgnify:CR=1 FL=1
MKLINKSPRNYMAFDTILEAGKFEFENLSLSAFSQAFTGDYERDYTELDKQIYDAIKNGTPLPKGHGRLIDGDEFISTLEDASKRQQYKKLLIDDYLTVDDVFKAIIESLQNKGLAKGDTPTIIEADKEASDG